MLLSCPKTLLSEFEQAGMLCDDESVLAWPAVGRGQFANSGMAGMGLDVTVRGVFGP